MGDPLTRRSAARSRLRHQLRRKRESLADQFDFKMYIVFHFKEKKKQAAIFEVAEVMPVMTNDYEDSIMKGVQDEAYSYESSRDLIEKDVVQLHVHRWQSMRRDVLGCTAPLDYFLWPRNDIDRIECRLFSRWKGEDDIFRPIQCVFEFHHVDYEKQLLLLLARREHERSNLSGLIINNPGQSMFLFVDKHHLQTSKNKVIIVKLSSMCLYIPQDQLTHWGPSSAEDFVNLYLPRNNQAIISCINNKINNTTSNKLVDTINGSHVITNGHDINTN